MRVLLLLLLWPVSAFALSEQDILDALRDPKHQGIVHLQPGEYALSHPIVLNEGQQLIGHDTTFKVTWPDSYWFTAVTIRPRKVESVPVAAILATQPRVKLKLAAALPETWHAGSHVAFCGGFPGEKGACQTLFSSIDRVQGDELTLDDPLTFSLAAPGEQALTLTGLVDMNCRVSGIAFSQPAHADNGLVYVNVEPYGENVSIADCRFDTGAEKPPAVSCGIVATQSRVDVTRCRLEGFSLDAIKFLDTGGGRIDHCTITRCNHAITLFLTQATEVSANVITDGAAAFGNFSTGIFLSGEPTGVWGTNRGGDKSCFNRIANNRIDGAGYGVPGAGFAAIHLHRRCHFNTIHNNHCTHNGMGIYLETDNDHNRVCFNVCSENNQEQRPNHYGNGIELDWDNDFNTLESNRCENNRGSSEALGYGIEIRNGTDHDNRYNTVAQNVIRGTGGVGLVVRGTGTRIVGNMLGDNGRDPASPRRREIEIEGNEILLAGNTITPSTISKDARPFGYCSIVVGSGEKITITDNEIDTGPCSEGAIVVAPGVRDLSLCRNRIASTMPFGAAISVDGAFRVAILGNLFKVNENGSAEIACVRLQDSRVDDTNRIDEAFLAAHRPGKPLRIQVVEGPTRDRSEGQED